MDIKQTVEDVKLRLRNDRRIWAVIGFVVVALVIWGGSSDRRNKKSRPGMEVEAPSQPNIGGNEAFNDLVMRFDQQIKNLASFADESSQRQDRLEKEVKQSQEKTAGLIEIMVERMEGLDEAVKRVEAQKSEMPDQTAPDSSGSMPQTDSAPDELASYGFDATSLPPPPAPPTIEKRTFISPGDSVPVRLLTGVAAPVDGTPYPVVLKLLGPVTGPDGSSLDIGEARLVAAAQGSETDGRVQVRITDLAFRHADGRRSVVKVDGWIVGEDGVKGVRGKTIDKLGQVILATMGYSGAAAFGERLNGQRNRLRIENSDNITVTGNDLDSALTSALTDGSIRLTQVLLEKYERLVPVVEVHSGRDIVAVFSRGAEVSIYDDEEQSGIHTAALD